MFNVTHEPEFRLSTVVNNEIVRNVVRVVFVNFFFK